VPEEITLRCYEAVPHEVEFPRGSLGDRLRRGDKDGARQRFVTRDSTAGQAKPLAAPVAGTGAGVLDGQGQVTGAGVLSVAGQLME
jgi:hypothetical protein